MKENNKEQKDTLLMKIWPAQNHPNRQKNNSVAFKDVDPIMRKLRLKIRRVKCKIIMKVLKRC